MMKSFSLFLKIAFKNIFRRKVNSLLVILGSLIGTALITGSFVMNDSFQNEIISGITNKFGEIDEYIYLKDTNNSGRAFFDYSLFGGFLQDLTQNPLIDGVIPVIQRHGAIGKVNAVRAINSAFTKNISILGVDFSNFPAFGEEKKIYDFSGYTGSLPAVMIPEKLANEIGVNEGDTLELLYDDMQKITIWKPLPKIQVYKIIKDESILNFDAENSFDIFCTVIMPLNEVQKFLSVNSPSLVNYILLSNKGDSVEGVKYTGDIFTLFKDVPELQNFTFNRLKETRINGADSGNFGIIFLGLSFFTIIAGMLLLSNIYTMLVEERKGELGTLRAIGFKTREVRSLMIYEGFFYTLISSFAGVGAGLLISKFILDQFNSFFQAFSFVLPANIPIPFEAFSEKFDFYVKPFSVFLSLLFGLIIPMIIVYFISRKISKMNIVLAVRGLPEEKNLVSSKKVSLFLFIVSIAALLLFLSGLRSNNPILLFSGLASFLILFPFSISWKGKNILITLANVVVIVFSIIYRPAIASEAFLPLALMVIVKSFAVLFSCSFLVVYNLKKFEKVLNLFSYKGLFNPSVTKVALAFPARYTKRTGLAIIMYALIIFVITIITVLPYSEEKAMLNSRDSLFIGYDVAMITFPLGGTPAFSNLIRELGSKEEVGFSTEILVLPAIMKDSEGEITVNFIFAVDDNFKAPAKNLYLEVPEKFKDSMHNPQEAFEFLRKNPDYSLIYGPMKFEEGNKIKQVIINQNAFSHKIVDFEKLFNTIDTFVVKEPVARMRSPTLTLSYGIFVNKEGIPENLLKDAFKVGMLELNGNTTEEKKENYEKILPYLQQSTIVSLMVDEIVEIGVTSIKGLSGIFRSFLFFGMGVGIAGIAIIMFRALYERRRLIGMLKAIGFTKMMVFNAFSLETSFIVLTGIILGVVSGILTAYQFLSVINVELVKIKLLVPWDQVISYCAAFYFISLLATFAPSMLAASLPPAKALQYYE